MKRSEHFKHFKPSNFRFLFFEFNTLLCRLATGAVLGRFTATGGERLGAAIAGERSSSVWLFSAWCTCVVCVLITEGAVFTMCLSLT